MSPKSSKKRKRHSLRRTFITGLVVILPLYITYSVVQFAFRQIDAAVTPYVLQIIRMSGFEWLLERGWINFTAPVVSVTLLVSLIYLLGLIASNVLGRRLLGWVERLLTTIPVVRGIYTATRQFLDTFSRDGKSFRKVVLIEYPRKGLWTLALLTSDTEGEVASRTDQKVVSVFIPTTPNPTSGWLLFVPKEDCIELEMSVDDAFKMIISGGVLTPPYAEPHQLPTKEVESKPVSA